MAKIEVCDICGEQLKGKFFERYKIKIKKEEKEYLGNGYTAFYWKRKDVCCSCQNKIIHYCQEQEMKKIKQKESWK